MRPIALLLFILVVGCESAAPPASEVEPDAGQRSIAARKERLLKRMETAMNALVRDTQRRIRGIRERLRDDLASLRPPGVLLAEERALKGYGAADKELFEAEIDRLVERAVDETVRIVGRPASAKREAVVGEVEKRALAIAREIGGFHDEEGIGIVSGIREIDEMAHVTVELLSTYADVVGLEDMGALRKRQALGLAQRFRYDVSEEDLRRRAPRTAEGVRPGGPGAPADVARLYLFGSDVVPDLRVGGQESAAFVVALRNDRLPLDHPIGLTQVRRVRVLRGGVVVFEIPWRFDPSVDERGFLPRRTDLVDERFVASDLLLPALDSSDPRFADLRDFTVVVDEISGAVDEVTGEVIGAFSWQFKWGVGRSGRAAWLEPGEPRPLEKEHVLTRLLGGSVERAARIEPAVDRWRRLRVPSIEVLEPPPRRDDDGSLVQVARYESSGVLSVPPEGRRFLLRHRLLILTHDLGFFPYRDGRRDRWVLRLTEVAEGSPVRDLGLRRNDDLLAINGEPIHDFPDLWQFFAEHPREQVYELLLDRGGALRRFRYRVEGAPGPGESEPAFDENPTDATIDRLERLFAQDVGDS